ncbi:MAG TPA: hypothetical protein VK766_11415 [Cytophagaceae bacterium]|nr:hypothetical protein [Cytophagaceae bacterium]
MKKHITIFSLFFFILEILSIMDIHAQGPTIHENSFRIQGDGFQNQSVKLRIQAHQFENNFYAKSTYNYMQEYQNMTVRISGANHYSTIAPISGIHMDFNTVIKPGLYTMDSAFTLTVFFKKDIPTSDYESYYVLDSDGEVKITLYEPVGGLIEGTFSGTFVKMKYNKQAGIFEETTIHVQITDGKFSAIHRPDYHWDSPISTGAEPENAKGKEKRNKE